MEEVTERKAIKVQWGLQPIYFLYSSLACLCTLSVPTSSYLTSMQIHLGFNYLHILYIITAARQYSLYSYYLRCP